MSKQGRVVLQISCFIKKSARYYDLVGKREEGERKERREIEVKEWREGRQEWVGREKS